MRKLGPFAAFLVVLNSSSLASQQGGKVTVLPVPASTISAGQIIQMDDLSERAFRTTRRSLAGIATTRSEIEGKEARRPLIAGRPIPSSAIMRPLVVRRGEKVTAFYEEAGFTISMQLLSMEDGSTGDVIMLRNSITGTLIKAEIRENGTIGVRRD